MRTAHIALPAVTLREGWECFFEEKMYRNIKRVVDTQFLNTN